MCLYADSVGRFAGTIPELGILVIYLACPFGWTESPACYWVAGGAIKHIYNHSVPYWSGQHRAFDGQAWCDDHISVEQDVGTRLAEANIALRSAMVAVLVPNACNDDKFTSWFTRGKALGLLWDTSTRTVSMPSEKMLKAHLRITRVLEAHSTTRGCLERLLGSLRHVITCVRAAAPFFQRVADLTRSAPRFGRVAVSDECRDDLHWSLTVLKMARLHSIPLERLLRFRSLRLLSLWMSVTTGLCVLVPAFHEFIQLEFLVEGKHQLRQAQRGDDHRFGINCRELMSAVFAAIVWGDRWRPDSSCMQHHVLFRIDNTTAIAWTNRSAPRNPFGQLLLRLLALKEVEFEFYSSAIHIAGETNTLADSGSRIWQSSAHAVTFTNLTRDWSQVAVPPDCRNLC